MLQGVQNLVKLGSDVGTVLCSRIECGLSRLVTPWDLVAGHYYNFGIFDSVDKSNKFLPKISWPPTGLGNVRSLKVMFHTWTLISASTEQQNS